ncbi:MAG: hypothetical protein ABJJ44_16480 [Paraglaciecola sp.]|uniref:hypothetical protein n=1 Tax=Paraglaciecola sp. TaxID=1920173 RepID=UPI0032977CA2
MQFTIPQVSAALLAVATGASAASWYIRGEQIDVLKEQVSSFQAFEEMDLLSLTKNANLATEKLSIKLKEIEDIDALIIQNKNQAEKILALDELNKSQLNKISILESQVKSAFSSTTVFSLKRSEHIKLFNSEYVVAIKSVQSDDVFFTLNNSSRLLSPGEYIKIENAKTPCKLFLESMESYSLANFSVLCEKI